MADLTAEQAIEKLRGLPEDKQRAVLSKISPDQRQGILDLLRTPQTAGERYMAARRSGSLPKKEITSFSTNPQQALAEAGQEAGEIAQEYQRGATPAMFREGKYVGDRSLLEQAANAIASGTFEMAGVGAKLASGLTDWKTATAFLVGKLSPPAAGAFFASTGAKQAYDALQTGKATPENVQNFLMGLSGVAAGTAGGMSGEQVSPAKIKAQLAEKAHSFARGATEARPAVKAAVEKAGEVGQRVELSKSVDQQSTALGKQIEGLEKRVGEEANRKFEAVKEKIGAGKPGEPTVSPEKVISAANVAQNNILQNIPENVKEFRAILKMSGESEEMGELRQQVMQGQGMSGNYADLSPERKGLVDDLARTYGGEITEGQPATWTRLQRIKTNIDTALRSRSTPPIQKYALRFVLDSVVDTMGQIAESKGATAEWQDARNYWQQWRKDFHEPTGPSGSGSPVAAALEAVDPKYVRQALTRTEGPTGNRATEILGRYAQFGGKDIATAAERMSQTQASAAELPKRAPGVKLAGQPKPTIDIDEVSRQQIANTARRVGRLNAWDFRVVAASAIAGVLAPFLGLERGVEMGGSYVAGKLAIARVLENPKVVNWIARTPPAELQALSQLPNIDKINVQSALTQTAIQTKTVPSAQLRTFLGPRNTALIMAAAAQGGKPVQTPAQAKERFQPQP